MSEAEILAQAQARASTFEVPYAGVLTPPEAASLLNSSEYVLIDVRTSAEWQFVGVPENALMIEYKVFPTMRVNTEFIAHLSSSVSSSQKLLFLCRSGARSHEAALLAHKAGFTTFNILEGFEGDLDEQCHRSNLNGWKKHGLPWRQS